MTSLLPFGIALLTVLAVTPPVQALARRIGFVDRPSARKVHAHPVPLGGGIALAAGILAGGLAGGAMRLEPRASIALLAGLLWIFVLGLRDDRSPLPPLAKLGGQLIAALVLVLGSGHPSAAACSGLAVPLATVGVVALMNACNFLDNMDGILAGIALVCGLGLLVVAGGGTAGLDAIAAAIAGAAAGFLAYNFHPARIFMGDAGSHVLGFLLAGVVLLILPPFPPLRPVYGLLLIIGYPLFDLTFVTITRLLSGRPVWRPGKDHTTHRLNRLLPDPRATALVVYGLASVCAAAGIAVVTRPGPFTAAAAAVSLAFLLVLGLRLARMPTA